ncbi:MAG: hypothetical protein MJ093_02500 [Saccharofermentans sp.]|nr:hypothetical protein [Saccharofermentans sp.]
MKKIKKIIAVLVMSVMILSVAACSKNDTTETEVSDSEVVSSESETVTETLDLTKKDISNVYGDQLPYYLNHQYYFNGEPISIVESNYYFIQSFSDLSTYAYYMGFPTTLDGNIDLSAPREEVAGSGEVSGTWGDYLVAYAEKQIKGAAIMRTLAEEKGFKVTEDDLADMEGFFSDLQADAVDPSGLTMDEYLQIYFGDNCTKDELLKVMCHLKLIEYYMADYADHYEFSDSELYVPNLRYALFYAPAGTSEDQMNSQKEACQALLDSCTDLDIFQVEGALAYANGGVYEYGDEIAVEKGKMVPEFEAWAWDESREVGDIDMIQTEAYGFFVVGYLGTTEVSDDSKANIAMAALNSEMDTITDNYEFYTNDEYTGVPEVITPTPDYQNVTVVREDGTVQNPKKELKDYTNIIIISLLGVSALGIIGAGVYGNVSKNKETKNTKNTQKKDKKNK